MPKTLRDAVRVTRALEVQYLWIDALCIIQGSDEKARKDWEIESSRMESVYGNSFVTIAAAASDACGGGLFYPRSCALQFLTQPTNVENHNAQTRKSITASIPNPTRGVKEEPLNCRAWALQERILSQRVLTYTFGGIFFQCAQGGLRTVDSKADWHHMYWYRFPNPPAAPKFSDWNLIVESFCSRDLTNPQDKLPAIAGLARRYEILTNGKDGRYLAGLWGNHILEGLLWCRYNDFATFYPKSTIGAAKTYRAPSWSWAAIDGIVSYIHIKGRRNHKFTTKVIECITEAATGDPFSSILSGKLVLSGPCKTATAATLSKDKVPELIDSFYNQTKDFSVGNLWLDDDDDVAI
jgi:hypothetical protein